MKVCSFCTLCFEDDMVSCPNDGNKLTFSRQGSRMILDKYRIDSLIGQGKMGTVYKATQLVLMREVAIKVLPTQLFNNQSAIKKFRTEALAVARLEHPNIINIYDYSTLPNGDAYMAMKLLKGHSLTKEISLSKQIPFMRILQIMQQVCSAISTAHENHVVHCDLRPDNIILDIVDGQELIQIVDFGIARLREFSSNGTLYSVHTGSADGAPSYMSPEQCLGEKLYPTSDIYSLGVILYQMLTGQVLFDSPIGADVALQHIKTPPPPPSLLRQFVSSKLDEVILKALAKTPKQRFQSAILLFEDLELALKESETAFLDANKQYGAPSKPTQELDKKTNPLNPEMLGLIRDSLEKEPRISFETSPLPLLPFKVPEPITTTNPEFSKLIILVVDDDENILETFSIIIESIGAQILTASDGEEAWKKIKSLHPHLIIADIIMPNVDGWQLFFRYKTDPKFAETPFIFVTGRDIEQEKVVALEQGAEDYWIKPFAVLEITVRLKRILKRISNQIK